MLNNDSHLGTSHTCDTKVQVSSSGEAPTIVELTTRKDSTVTEKVSKQIDCIITESPLVGNPQSRESEEMSGSPTNTMQETCLSSLPSGVTAKSPQASVIEQV